MDEPGSHFLNPATINIDPSLGVVSTGVTDVSPPAFNPETGEVAMPAAISTGKPLGTKRQFYKFKPGGTLAERLGTSEAENTAPTPELPTGSQPIDVPERIVPRSRKTLSPEEMSEKLKPAWDKIPEVPDPEEHPPIVDQATPTPEVHPQVPVPAKADLKGLVCAYIQKFGIEKSSEFFGKTPATVSAWLNGSKEPPLAAAQLVLDKSPKARSQYLQVVERVSMEDTLEGSFSRDHTKEELPVDLCLAVKGDIPPVVHWIFTTAVAKYGLGQKMLTDTIIIRSRNLIADMFLKGKAQWSIWLDADVVPTIGNELWWRAIVRDASVSSTTASYDFIKRLLSHNKPFVGGVYATRRREGPLVIQPDLHPRASADVKLSNEIRSNRARGLQEVEWLSAGYCLVHRIVFETIMKKFPELRPSTPGEPYPFFTPTANEGEDVKLSMLARKAGFKLYLDTELFAAHIGRWAYTPFQSVHNGPVNVMNAQT